MSSARSTTALNSSSERSASTWIAKRIADRSSPSSRSASASIWIVPRSSWPSLLPPTRKAGRKQEA